MTGKMDEVFNTHGAQSRRPYRQDDVGPRALPDPTKKPQQRAEAHYNELSPQDAERVGQAVTEKDLNDLAKEVTKLYEQVTEKFQGTAEQAAQALIWLNEAHMVAIARPDQFMLGKFRVLQTRLLLRQVTYSQQSANKYQWRLTLWNLLWLIGLGALFGLDRLFTSMLTRSFLPTGVEKGVVDSLVWFFQPWYCVLAGGIGGALAALMILGRQVSSRQFDPASNLDYFLNPLKGVILGGVSYYILLGGFITVAVASTISEPPAGLSNIVQIAKSPLFILIAFIAGFAQTRIVEYLPRVWGQVTGGKKEEQAVTNQVTRVMEASSAFSRNRTTHHDPSMVNGYAMGDRDQYDMADLDQDPSSQMNDYPDDEFLPKDDNYEPFSKVRRT